MYMAYVRMCTDKLPGMNTIGINYSCRQISLCTIVTIYDVTLSCEVVLVDVLYIISLRALNLYIVFSRDIVRYCVLSHNIWSSNYFLVFVACKRKGP